MVKTQNPGQQGGSNMESEEDKAKNKEPNMISGNDKEENPHGDWMIVNKRKKWQQK